MFAIQKVLIGCDGVNSVVAKWLGFKEAAYTGRYAIRGCAELESNHNFEPLFMQFSGKGFRAGVVPCDEKTVYWFFTWTPTIQGKFPFFKHIQSEFIISVQNGLICCLYKELC
jgi:2-polyprenyl-6-methoxyphenol hydroxylase-like FAD-dependent oxidoreductase